MRVWLGIAFMKIGMAILPSRVRRLTANMIMYHVPGALTEPEKAEIEFEASGYRARRCRGVKNTGT